MTLADDILAALVEARDTFKRYGALHHAKHTADADAESAANYALAMRMATAIGALTPLRAAEPAEPFKRADSISWHKPAHRAVMASVNMGRWLSAALDDPKVCEAMKADIREWFSAGEPVEMLGQALAHIAEPAEPGQVTQEDRDAAAIFLEKHHANVSKQVFAIRRGQRDDDPLVQAFANHRALGIEQGRAQELAEIVAWLRAKHNTLAPLNFELWADAIARGEHKEPKP